MKNKTLFHDLLISIISGVVVGTIVGRILRTQQIATARAPNAGLSFIQR